MEPDIFHKNTFMSISNFYFQAYLQTAFLFKNYFADELYFIVTVIFVLLTLNY